MVTKEDQAGTSTESTATTTAAEATQAPPAEGEAITEEEPDYQALYEVEKQGRAKAENDLKSVQGNRSKRDEVSNRITGIEDSIASLARVQGAVARRQGDDALTREVDQIEQNQAYTQASAQAQTEAEVLFQDMEEAYTLDDGTTLVENPEFAEAIQYWTAGSAKNTTLPMAERLQHLRAGVFEANKARRRVDREANKKAASVAERAAAGSDLDLDVGGPGAGGSVSDREFKRRFAQGEISASEANMKRMVKIKKSEGVDG